jgi:hypothetical protein
MNERIIELNIFPSMDTGAPLPATMKDGSDLFVSYVCANPDFQGWNSGAPQDHPGFDEYCAVIKFEDVDWYHFGEPSDEKLHEHPLYEHGLTFYGFHEVEGSKRKNRENQRHWIITFHDEILEVLGSSVELISGRIDTSSPEEALTKI